MTYPSFTSGDILTAADMNAVGLWLVKTQTVGSAVATVEVTGAFSSTYDNYRIMWSGISCSTGNDWTIQLGNSGGYSTTGYYRISPYVTSASAFVSGFSANGTNFFMSSTPSSSTKHVGFLEVFQPYSADFTTFSGPIYQQRTDLIGIGVFGAHQVATSYDRFKITVSTGTITGGTIRVYGYKNGIS
jgi:hypothetical protein